MFTVMCAIVTILLNPTYLLTLIIRPSVRPSVCLSVSPLCYDEKDLYLLIFIACKDRIVTSSGERQRFLMIRDRSDVISK